MNDSFRLQHFIDAQDPVFDQVRQELRQGRKQSHWMWFIFPQVAGLGSSPMASRFAISSLAHAKAYLQDPVLGPRLKECVGLVLQVERRTAPDIFGHPDDMKFRSSLTLFARAAPGEPVFKEAIQKYFNGEFDPLTLERL